MNLVGKIFVFLVFVMSLAFAFMTMMVFQTHTNWKEVVENTDTSGGKTLGLRKQLENEQEKSKKLASEIDELQKDLNRDKARKAQALAALETEKIELQKIIDSLAAQLAKSRDEARKAFGEIEMLTTVITDLQTEIDGTADKDGLRAQIAKVLASRDAIYDKALRLTDEVNQAQGDVWRLQELKKTIEQQLTQAVAVLRIRGLNINSPDPGRAPGVLNGLVAKVSKTGQLVEVTVGYDDGLRKDHTMEVYNNSRYLGRMKVIETKPDSAVGRMEVLNGRIQRGDRVATKLKVG